MTPFNPLPTPASRAPRPAVFIDALEDEIFNLEDELDLAAEEAYLAEEAIEGLSGEPGTPTMADLEGGAPRRAP